MDTLDAIRTRRTIRRFSKGTVTRDQLILLMDAARLAPSAANLQPLEYIAVDDPEQVLGIYEFVRLGSYLKGDDIIGSDPTEAPSAYIAVCYRDTGIQWSMRDIGASVQNILLASHALGLGACWIANIQRGPIRARLAIPEDLELDCLIALGPPAETSRTVTMEKDNYYFYEAPGQLCVPKRKPEDLMSFNSYGPGEQDS